MGDFFRSEVSLVSCWGCPLFFLFSHDTEIQMTRGQNYPHPKKKDLLNCHSSCRGAVKLHGLALSFGLCRCAHQPIVTWPVWTAFETLVNPIFAWLWEVRIPIKRVHIPIWRLISLWVPIYIYMQVRSSIRIAISNPNIHKPSFRVCSVPPCLNDFRAYSIQK